MVDAALDQARDVQNSVTSKPTQDQVTSPEMVPTEKYKVFQAIGDAMRGISLNFGIFMVACILLAVMTAAVSYITPILTFSLLLTFPNIIVITILTIVIQTITSVALQGVFLIIVAVMIDAEKNRANVDGRTIVSVLRTKLIRVMLALLLQTVVILLPFIIAFVIALTMLNAATASAVPSAVQTSLTFFAPILAIILFFRYALVPIIAFFEPNRSYLQLLSRSYFLLRGGGQWFLFKLVALNVGVAVLFLVVLRNIPTYFEMDSGGAAIATALLIVGIQIIATAVLVVLYLNRKAVRQ